MLENFSAQNGPIGVHSVTVDENGALASRAPSFPLNFDFEWRESRFEGSVDKDSEGFKLKLATPVGTIPFTAENAAGRSTLLAQLSDESQSGSLLTVENGNRVVFSRHIAMPSDGGFAADNLVTNLAVVVLTAAPCLDAMAEFGHA